MSNGVLNELKTMEQQQLLDALVEHLGIYHRASVANTQSRARQTIVKWMIGLNCEQRRAALTIVDAPWIGIVLKMQERLKEGMCTFFLLPDVPTTNPKGHVDSGGDRATGSHGGKVDSTSHDKGGRLPRLSGPKTSDPVSAACSGKRATKGLLSSSLPLPELCFKRARGLVGRLETGRVSGELLVNSIRLFSSHDGEDKATHCCSDTASILDCLTLTEEFVANIEVFLEVMDDLTNHEFLNTPSLSAASPWEEMPWLQSSGYYSLPAFIANKLEFGLWSAWNRTQGSKRPPKSLGLQSFKAQRMTVNSSSGSQNGNAAAAATVFARNQGCMDWWNKLGSKERTKLVTKTVALATKFEVFEVLVNSRTAGENVSGAEARDRANAVSRNSGNTRGTIARRRSSSNLDVDKFAKPGENEAAVAPYVRGLRALKELSESGFLCGKFEGMNSMQEDDGRWLFDSTLKSVHSFSDRIRRKVRNELVKVRNDLVERELLGDESSGKAHKANKTDSSGVKVTKTKKKRRKSATSSKTGVPQIAEAAKVAGHSSPKEEALKEDQSASRPNELEVQVRSPDISQVVNEAQYSIEGGRQVLGRKGKGGRGKMNVKSQQPMPLEKSAMKDDDVLPHSNGSCSTFTQDLDTFSDIRDGAPSPRDRPSYRVQTVHDSSQQNSSRSAIHLDKQYPRETESSLVRSLDLPSDKKTLNNIIVDEVPAADLIPAVVTSSASDVDILEDHDLQGESLFSTHEVVQVQDCARPTGDMSSSRKTENGRSDVYSNSDASVAIGEASNVPNVKEQASAFEKATAESRSICVGTIDIALPELQRSSSNASSHARSPLNRMASWHCKDVGCAHKSDVAGCHTVHDRLNKMPPEADKRGSKEGIIGVPHGDGKAVPQTFSGLSRFTKASRQLDYTNSRHSQFQRGTAFRPIPHEWPGSPQYGYFGAYHQPTATEWLQLDVGQGLPQRMESPLLTYRSTPILRQQQSGQAERPALRTVASWTSNVGNVDMAPVVQPTYNISPAGTYSVTSNEDSRLSLRPFFNPSPLSSSYPEMDVSGQGRTFHEPESDDRFTYDTDGDDYGIYRSGEFDDLDGYLISEEEVERYAEDIAENNSADYHEIFGGGVMYWNAADYTGQGYSRPGSLSSDDSSWARHEADLSVVLDDIVNYQPLQASFSAKGHASSAVPSCSPSPPSSSSVPLNFEHLSPMASSNPRHCMPRPTGMEFPGKFVQLSNQGVTAEDQSVNARVPVTLEVIEQISSENSAQAMLRPLVVVRDLSLARQSSTSDVSRLQEAKSPHMVSRSRRDLPGHRMRPPSPVSRCVPPPAPPPPPPSPVAGPKRRKGFMAARSGSSSPRHWGFLNWSQRDELDFREGPEGLPGLRRGGMTGTSTVHPVSGALLRERLVAIPPLSLEQEHPDVSIPMKTTLLHNSNPAFHPGLTKLLSALHVEIEAFSRQVGTENKLRKPFINVAEKKVAHSLQVLWPRSRVKIFGSVATGLALPTSDVDLVVCLPPVRNLEPIKEAGILEGRNGIKETSLQHAARYLADQDWVKNDSMKIIENTAVPVIMMVAEFLPHQCELSDDDAPSFLSPNIRKETCGGSAKGERRMAEHASTSVRSDSVSNLPAEDTTGPWGGKAARQLVHLDISFETPFHNGLRTAELVRELVGLYPALSPLALVLKQFLTDRSLDRPYTGGLSSYCLVLLITRFLQHQQHQQHQQHPVFRMGDEREFEWNLGRLFMDFLHFFGCVFDPRRMGVRIRGGGMYVSRDRYNNIDPLYIEDPLYPENNVGRNCFRVMQCVKAFADGYAVLENKLQETSTGTADPGMGVDCLELLQMIQPCIMTK